MIKATNVITSAKTKQLLGNLYCWSGIIVRQQ
jgi:hypothetical protein